MYGDQNSSAQITKSKPYRYKSHSIAAFIIFTIFAVTIAFGAWYFLTNVSDSNNYQTLLVFRGKSEKPAENPVDKNAAKEVVPDFFRDWNKFVSPNYGFSFRYPKTTEPALFDSAQTTCKVPLSVEEKIDEHTRSQGAVAAWNYGEFFRADVFRSKSSIEDWVKKKDPEGIRNLHQISVTGAKEAVQIDKNLNKQVEGYPPLAYIQYVLRDERNIYEILSFQNAGFSGDCVPNNFNATLDQIIKTFNFYN